MSKIPHNLLKVVFKNTKYDVWSANIRPALLAGWAEQKCDAQQLL